MESSNGHRFNGQPEGCVELPGLLEIRNGDSNVIAGMDRKHSRAALGG